MGQIAPLPRQLTSLRRTRLHIIASIHPVTMLPRYAPVPRLQKPIYIRENYKGSEKLKVRRGFWGPCLFFA